MFTGIIQSLGKVRRKEAMEGDVRVTIDTLAMDLSTVQIGDSIACNGICLTVIELLSDAFVADVSNETLSLTTLKDLDEGSALNLEKALKASDHLGGHIVSGHVDGIGDIIAMEFDGRSQRFSIKAGDQLAPYIAHKGSITVDGVSLTINRVTEDVFELCIVPHTLKETIFHDYKVGSQVNLEVDVIARYVERLMGYNQSHKKTIDYAFLSEHGFGGKS
jgi:riboflavin synthase